MYQIIIYQIIIYKIIIIVIYKYLNIIIVSNK